MPDAEGTHCLTPNAEPDSLPAAAAASRPAAPCRRGHARAGAYTSCRPTRPVFTISAKAVVRPLLRAPAGATHQHPAQHLLVPFPDVRRATRCAASESPEVHRRHRDGCRGRRAPPRPRRPCGRESLLGRSCRRCSSGRAWILARDAGGRRARSSGRVQAAAGRPPSRLPRKCLRAAQLGQHVVRAEAVKAQQHQRVKPQVCRFADDMQFITVFGREQGLGRLLARPSSEWRRGPWRTAARRRRTSDRRSCAARASLPGAAGSSGQS